MLVVNRIDVEVVVSAVSGATFNGALRSSISKFYPVLLNGNGLRLFI